MQPDMAKPWIQRQCRHSKTKKPVVGNEATKLEDTKLEDTEQKAAKPKTIESKVIEPEADEGLSWLV